MGLPCFSDPDGGKAVPPTYRVGYCHLNASYDGMAEASDWLGGGGGSYRDVWWGSRRARPTQANDYCIRLPLTCVRKIVAPKVGHHAFQQRIRHLVGERCGWLRGERRSRGDPMPGLDVSLEPSKVQMFIDMNMVRECGSYSGSYPRQLRPRRYSAASAQHAGTPVEHGSLRPAPASPTVCNW